MSEEINSAPPEKFWIDMDGLPVRIFSEKRRVESATYQPTLLLEIGITLEALVDHKVDIGALILKSLFDASGTKSFVEHREKARQAGEA